MPGDGLQQQGGPRRIVGERAYLIERASESHQAIATDQAISGLEPDNATQAGRLTDGAPGIGTQ